MRLEIWVSALPKLPNRLLGAHWTICSSHAKKWKRLVGDALLACREPHHPIGYPIGQGIKKATITLTRCSPRECDTDNMISSFKPVLDALVHHGVLEDDTPQHITCEYKHEKTPKARQGIRVEVESCE